LELWHQIDIYLDSYNAVRYRLHAQNIEFISVKRISIIEYRTWFTNVHITNRSVEYWLRIRMWRQGV